MHLVRGEVSDLTLNPQARLSLEQYRTLYENGSVTSTFSLSNVGIDNWK